MMIFNKVMCILGKCIFEVSRFCRKCKSLYLSSLLRKSGGGVSIGPDTDVSHPENIYISQGSYINGGQLVAGTNSKIIIGSNVLISYNVHIRTVTHQYHEKDKPIIKQGGLEKDIVIGDNVWIGYGAQIMPGVHIGDGSVVGAGAVVTKDIGENEVWGGVPAHFIKER